MASTSLVVEVPNPLYAVLMDRAAQSQRTVQEEAIHVMELALPLTSGLSESLRNELDQLANLNDDELWSAARTLVRDEISERLEDLSFTRSERALTAEERKEQQQLLRECDRVMLVRAHAAVLLKDRGFDITSLGPKP